MIKVNAIGLSCPEPVILLKKELEKNEKQIELHISCGASVENTKRLAKKYNYTVSSSQEIDDYTILKLVKNDIS